MPEELNQETNQDPSQSTTDTSLETPVNNAPPAPPAWHSALYEANQRAQQAERELEALRNRAPAPAPTPEPPMEPGDLISNPQGFFDRIRKELHDTVAPLRAETEQTRRVRNYASLKQRVLSSNPQIAGKLRLAEPYIDQHLAPVLAERDVTDSDLATAFQSVVGWAAINSAELFMALMGQPGNAPTPNNPAPTPPQPNNPTPNPVLPPNIPAHLRAPGNTLNNNTPKRATWDDLNEHERRIAREQGMGPNQFIAWRDCPPEQLNARYDELTKITD